MLISFNWLNQLSENMPVFGAEMLVADRRLKDRFKRFRESLNTWRGISTVIFFTLLISYAATNIYSSLITSPDEGYYLVYVLGFFVVPIYASLNALAVGIMTLTDALDRNIAAEWTAAGVSPNNVAKQLLFVRVLRQLLPAVIYALIFLATFLTMSNHESPDNYIGVWQILAILTAFVSFQYMFIFAASFFSVLVRTLVGRFLIVAGYYISHIVLPIVAMVIFTEVVFSSEHENIIAIAFFTIHPYGPLISSCFLTEGSGLDFNPILTFFLSTVVQISYSLLFLNFAKKGFIRKVLQ